jgi:eukaryotic-like serine/threonine-protein kinase
MPISIDEFVRSLTETGILPPDEVTSLVSSLPDDRTGVDVEKIAKKLVKEQKLTRFQASAIFRRQSRGLRFGDYIVLDKVGSGGIGQVFKAENRQSGQTVALKLLRATYTKSQKAVARFYREAETAARLRHPNLVSVCEAGEWHGLHFLVMELIDGRDVRSVVKETGPLSVVAAVDIILQAARGLEYAHAHGIIHRDIKPANLLLDMIGRLIILDLGLARLEEPDQDGDGAEGGRLTMPGTFLGTFDYVAPEQAVDAHDVDGRCDIYSLGCTLYYLLRGRPPYRRENAPQTLLAHCQDPIPNLLEEFPGVPRRLAALFQRMLAKLPSGRVGTMTEVVAELEACQRELTGGVTPPAANCPPAHIAREECGTAPARRVDPPAATSVPRPAATTPVISPEPAPASAAANSRSDDTSVGITATETDPANGRRRSRPWLAFARAPFTAAWSAAVRAKDWLRHL